MEPFLRALIERGVPPGEIILYLIELIDRVVAEACVTPDERVEMILNVANMLVERSHGVPPEAYLARC
jgi:hypothetical protein